MGRGPQRHSPATRSCPLGQGIACQPSGPGIIGIHCHNQFAGGAGQEGIAQSLYYSWSKEFLEAGKKRLAGDTVRQANTGEAKDLRAEALALKELVADLSLENRLLKKNMTGAGGDHE